MSKERLLYGDSLCHAMVAYCGENYVYLDDEECVEQLGCVDHIESTVMRKTLYENLSDEAKSVIALIIQAPAEVVTELKKINLPGYQNYSNGYMQTGGFSSNERTAIFKKERIACYLRKKWGKRLLVRKVIGELEEYADNLGRI